MKRTPLKRKTWLRAKSKTKKYALRARHFDWMLAVKLMPCCLWFLGCCDGEVEADHAGDRGLGEKSHDNTTIPLCTRHHRERTDMTGYFASFDRHRMREWRHERVDETQVTLLARGYSLEPASDEPADLSPDGEPAA